MITSNHRAENLNVPGCQPIIFFPDELRLDVFYIIKEGPGRNSNGSGEIALRSQIPCEY